MAALSQTVMEVSGVLPDTVTEYVLWTNPARSAALFGVGTFAWYLIVVQQYSVLTLASYSAVLYLLTCFSYVNIIHIWSTFTRPNEKSQLRKTLFPDDETWLEVSMSEEYHAALVKACNKGLRYGRDIVYCRDNLETLKALGACFFLAVIGWFVDVVAFIYLVFFLSMTLPLAYSLFPEPFDNALDKVRRRIPATYEEIIPLIPVIRRDLDEDDEEDEVAHEDDAVQQRQQHQQQAQSHSPRDQNGRLLPHPLADVSHDDHKE